MRIGILFCDNYFYNTCFPFLKVLNDLIYERGDSNISKKDVADLFNEVAYGIYIFVQNKRKYKSGTDMRKYLKIKKSDVYFDEEIDVRNEKYSCGDNGEFFIVDVDNQQFNCR